MKKVIIAMTAIVAAFTMSSCVKEQIIESGGSITGGICIITAYTESDLTKTSLNGDDYNGYNVVWSKGDKISIGGNIFTLTAGEGTTKGTFQGTLPKDGTYTANYPVAFGQYSWDMDQNYSEGNITGSPMKAEVTISDGKLTEPLSFKNAGGILRLRLKGNAAVTHIYAYGADAPKDFNIHMKCGAGVQLNSNNGTVFHIAIPENEYPEAGFVITTVDGTEFRKKLKSDITFVIKRSQITDATVSDINSTAPAGMLPGKFSIGEGRQVHFSKGNLRYTCSTRTWSFFDRQYLCGPLDKVDGSEISLFTWGYNAEKSIKPYGNDGDNVSIVAGMLSPEEDWASTIDSRRGVWRTLTKDDWVYLFKNRKDAEKKYGYATVGNVPGIIILPDDFTDPGTNGGNGAFKPRSSTSTMYNDNIYTSGGNWEAMEYAGAVFLPASGRRNGDSISPTQGQGFYWSSATYDTNGNASYLHFANADSNESIEPAEHCQRSLGCSVRLVTDVYTVTYDLNGKTGGKPVDSKTYTYGSKITKPSDAIAEGYTFAGWFKEEDCKTMWNFESDVITDNITLYAGWADGLISGKFTVSSDGKQVYFTRGNLWADSYEGIYALHFEDNQYDFNDKYDLSHVSHFSWSGYVEGAVEGTGTENFLFCDEDHKVSINGSNPVYYALSKDEWQYLLTGRKSAPYYGWYAVDITIGGVKGIVIYPDDYKGGPIDPGTELSEQGFFDNHKGCVFLPAAGWRDGEKVKNSGYKGNGFYWTSTATANREPYSMSFLCRPRSSASDEIDGDICDKIGIDLGSGDGGEVYISEPGDPKNGLSIRLVVTVPRTPGEDD